MATTNQKTYFAAVEGDDVGPLLAAKLEQYETHDLVTQIDARLYNAWRFYFGFSNDGLHSTSVVRRGGEQGELALVRVNHSRALVNALLNLIVAPKFVWSARAANIDYESVRQTELAQSVLEHYWHTKKVAAFASRAVEEAIAFSEGFILTEWDDQEGQAFPTPQNGVIRTGDIRFTNVSSWDVIRDPTKKSWDDLDWVIVRVWRNKFNLAARFKDKEEEILNAPAETDERSTNRITAKDWGCDDLPVHMLFHKPTAAVPFGREVYFLADGTVIHDDVLAYEAFPIHRVSPAEFIGTPFGYSSYLEILGLQELSDSIHSSLATNISTFAAQSIAAEEGSPLQVDELAGGMRVVYYRPGGKPPEPLQLTQSPPEAYKYLDSLKGYQELLMGLNAVVRGEAQSDKMSGAALALLQSQALQQASTLQGNYVRMLESMGTMVMRIIKKRATAPLKIGIVGKNKLDLVRETEVTGTSIEQIDQVYVELGNPISQTAAGRFELGQLLVQMKMVASPEQLQQVFDTGRLDPLTKRSSEELLNILRENQDMSQGQPVHAMIHDQHLLHGREHPCVVATPAARRDPNIIAAYTRHMHEHYEQFFGVPPGQYVMNPMSQQEEFQAMDPNYRERMLILTGQQPPPPMMPPMPMGPGGPPPPGGPGGPPPPGGADAAPPDGAPSPPAPVSGAPPPNMPSMPTNPATGQKFNNVDGGGAVPR